MSKLKPYFDVLGIPPTENRAQIKKAYRKLAFQYHPDYNDSPEAEAEFVRIHEAYEIVTGIRAATSRSRQKASAAKTEEELFREKMEYARAQYERMNERDKARDEAYFKKYFEGWRWAVFKWIAVYAVIFNCFIIADFFIPSEEITIEPHEFVPDYWAGVIHIDNNRFAIEHYEFWEIGYPGVRGNRTFFFDDIKSISYVVGGTPNFKEGSPSYRMRENASFDQYNLHTSYCDLSIYSAFPYMNVVMCIPLALVFLKRKAFWLNIVRLLSVYVIFSYTVAVTLGNYRILHLLQILD